MNIWQLTGIIHDEPALSWDGGRPTLTFTLKNTEDKKHRARSTFVVCIWPAPPAALLEAFKPHTLVYVMGNGTLSKREFTLPPEKRVGPEDDGVRQTNSLALVVLEGSVAGEAPPLYSKPRKATTPPPEDEDRAES